jgi:hypothetical protein
MTKILFGILMISSLNLLGSNPDSLRITQSLYNKYNVTDNKTDGLLMLVAGLTFTSIGVFREYNRKPEVLHSYSVKTNPNNGKYINYMMIGAGIGFTIGGGIKLIR